MTLSWLSEIRTEGGERWWRGQLLSVSLVLVLIGSFPATAQVVLNEVVSRNAASLTDADGDTPDWIELHNVGSSPIRLLEYTLADGAGPERWALPDVALEPQAFFVVFASGKNRRDGEAHADFRIAGDGEILRLYGPGGTLADEVSIPPLAPDEAYVRVSGAAGWRRSTTPTPGGANAGNALRFSHAEGFYSAPFALEVTAEAPDTIRFTLDGSEPTVTSPVYLRPLALAPRDGEVAELARIPTTAPQKELSYKAWAAPRQASHQLTVARFATWRDGKRTSRVYTKTFAVDGALQGRYTVPVVSLVTERAHLFDPETGIYVTGERFDPANPEWTGNAFMREPEWERPTHVTFFEADGTVAFSQDAGIRIHGGKTRQAAQKSLRLYARGRYGDGAFDHAVFPGRPTERYERLVLRTSMGAWVKQSIIADAVAHEIVAELDLEAQDQRPVVVYLNGEYWGLHTLVDRIDERYVAYRSGVPEDSVELWGWTPQSDYHELIAFAEGNDLGIQANYERVAAEIDVENFITYTIAEQFFANTDWPANNSTFWRERGRGGKWRWIFYDLDAGFVTPELDMFERMMVPPSEEWSPDRFATTLFRNLIAHAGFRERFVARYTELLVTTFSPEETSRRFERVRDAYRPEVGAHAARWGEPSSVGHWETVVNDQLLGFLRARPCIVAEQLTHFFDLDSLAFSCAPPFPLAGLRLAPNPSDGLLYVRNDTEADVYFERVSVVNAVGQSVYTQRGALLRSGERLEIDLTGEVGAGVYTVVYEAEGRTDSRRVVIVGQPR